MSQPLAINGGTPVRDINTKPWTKWPFYDKTEEEALLRVLHSDNWWYMEGTEGKTFETEFAEMHNAKYAVACVNGSAALEVSLRALGIGCGDEVIVPPYTFIATVAAVLTVGATPIFVDIEGDTLNIDPTKIEEAITPRTKAVIPVHIAGRPADLDGVLEFAHKHHLHVIEDAAQAHYAEWRGTKVGAIGDFGTFSFQASKNLNAGEGGIILTNNEELADRAWSVTHVGRVRSGGKYRHEVLGGNYRMTEFQSALLRTQMQRLPEQTQKRTENAKYLRSRLLAIEGIELPKEDPRITVDAYHLFTMRFNPEAFGGKSKAELVKALHAEGIPCTSGYVPLYKESIFATHSNKQGARCQVGQRPDYPNLNLPVCEQVCKENLWLFQNMLLGNPSDMDDVVTALDKIQRAWR